MGEMITMITGIARRSAGMRVNLKQCDGNSPKTKEKAGKSLIQELKMHGKSIVNGCAKVEFEKNKRKNRR